MLNHFAYFDCLAISLRLQGSFGNVALSEIHLFAYLACLLSLYKKRPISDWGYEFAITKYGYPFSAELTKSADNLLETGLLLLDDEYVVVTEIGEKEWKVLYTLTQNSDRDSFIDGACSSLLALPVGTIRKALSQEPEIRNATTLSQSRRLFSSIALENLYEQFTVLSAAIGVEVKDLMIPAVVWLTYLSEIANFQIEGQV